MDAVSRFGRWARGAAAAGLVAGAGCKSSLCESCSPCSGGSCSPAKSRVSESAPAETVARPQAPDGPIAPVVPLTPGPSQKAAAPVVPYTPPAEGPATAPAGQPVQQVSATDAAAMERAATQVRVVAQIGTDVVITDDEIWQYVRQDAKEYVQLTGAARDAKEKELFRASLRRVIERELVISDFLGKLRKNGKAELVDKVMEEASQSAAKQMRQFRVTNKVASEEEMAKGMRAQGLSYKALVRQLERAAIENIYLGSILKDETKKQVGLAQIELYYQTHPGEFRVEDKVTWHDLFVSFNQFPSEAEARKYAEGLVAKLKAGQDFGEVAMNFSHGMTKLNKGEGVGEKRGEINPPELEQVVFTQPVNQLSGLIPTPTGLHVVRVAERVQAGVKPFDEKVQAEIKAKLTNKVRETERAKLIEELWRKTTVKIVEVP